VKRISFWLGGVLAALASVIGIGVAVIVGPDSIVQPPARVVDGGSPLLVVSDSLTRYDGTTLRVTVSSDKGPAFAGAAHTIDAASYIGSAKRVVINQVSAGGNFTTRSVGDAAAPTPPEPASLDIWSAKAVGEGEQTLSLALTGQPVQVVVRTVPGATVTVQLGVTVPGLFGLAGGLAVVGIVGLGVLVWLRRRSRGVAGGSAGGAGTDAANAAVPTRAAVAVDERDDVKSTVAQRRSRTARAVGVGVLTASALSGCIALPQAVPAPKEPVTKVALAQADVARVLADYDKRNNAVIAGLVKKLDARAWDAVDSGPILAADHFGTALRQARGESQEPARFTHAPGALYSPELAAYPMWAMVTATVSEAPGAPAEKPELRLLTFQRASAAAPWKMHLGTNVDVAPSAPVPGAASSATAKDVATGVAAMKTVITWFEKGTTGALKPSAPMADLRKAVASSSSPNGTVTTTCQPYLVQEEPAKSIRVVRTAKGVLTMLTLLCEVMTTAKNGYVIGSSTDYAKVLGTSTQQGDFVRENVLVTVSVESRGASLLGIGARATTVRMADTDLH
jgi:hypothetical protein